MSQMCPILVILKMVEIVEMFKVECNTKFQLQYLQIVSYLRNAVGQHFSQIVVISSSCFDSDLSNVGEELFCSE